jgi:competence CoiA-like predicted nuclease
LNPSALKSGEANVNYFAHENPLVCVVAPGESEAHESGKMQIFESQTA